jgi:hypothetical protein
MRALHWSSPTQARQIALCASLLATQQGSNTSTSAMPPQAATQLLQALAAPLYAYAGAAVGLAQGYAYAAAEVCAALGLSDLERQFRAYVPPKAPPAAAVDSSSSAGDQPGRLAGVTGVFDICA